LGGVPAGSSNSSPQTRRRAELGGREAAGPASDGDADGDEDGDAGVELDGVLDAAVVEVAGDTGSGDIA
jgi:hypothetical protein